MIHKISSDLPPFKTLAFRPGLNVILAEKSVGSTDRNTRNGAGKSSIVELIHFLLGGSCRKDGIFASSALREHAFEMVFDLGDSMTSVSRRGAEHKKVFVDNSHGFHEWPFQPTLDPDSGNFFLTTAQWTAVLGELMFGLPADTGKYGPTFRSVFPYFARRQADGGFTGHQSFVAASSVGDQQVALSFLLGLDWTIPRDLDLSRDRNKSLKTLKKEAGSGVLESLMGRAGDLRSQLAIAEKRARKFKDEIDNFQVLPEYRELEQEASAIARTISSLANANYMDEIRKRQLLEALEQEKAPETEDVARVYQEAGVVFQNEALRRLDDVRRFHEAVIANRKRHLEGDLRDVVGGLESRLEEMRQLQRFSRGCSQYPQWRNQLRQSSPVTAANASPRPR